MAQHVLSHLTPAGDGRWPILEDAFFIGGYRVVPTLADRDEIYTNDDMRPGLKLGALVQVYESRIVYRWDGLNDDGSPNWGIFARPNTYVHRVTADNAAQQWVVSHGMKTTDFTVTVFLGPSAVMPKNIKIVDDSNVVLEFASAVAGKAVFYFHFD